jgi:hypothetical protein
MHENDRREDAYVNYEPDQLLGSDLRGLRQGVGHAVKGREDG